MASRLCGDKKNNAQKIASCHVCTKIVQILTRPYPVETRRATSIHDETTTNSEKRISQRDIADMHGWLSVVIGGMKSSVTNFANQNAIPFAWQPRFHDRIIRTTDEINRVAYYIENNVAQWQCDEFFK